MDRNEQVRSNLHSSMEGRFAVVTGSTQGLGEAAVRLFAERGAAGIIVSGRNAERGNAVAADLRGGGCQAHFVQADLADVDACRGIVAEADRRFGALDMLVNSGALTVRGNIWDTTPELFDRMIAVNAQRAVAAHAGRMQGDAARGKGRVDRQYLQCGLLRQRAVFCFLIRPPRVRSTR